VSDARQLRTRGDYQAQVPLKALIEDVVRIRRMLDEAVTLKGRIRVFAGVSFVAGVVGLIASSALSIAVLGFCGLLAFFFGVALFIYSFIGRSALQKSRDRVDVMKGLSEKLQPDADPQSPFSVRLALTGEPKLVRTEPMLTRKNGQQHLLEEDFLSLEGKLRDGTVLTETVKELTRKRTFVNSNRKSKTKIRHRYLATLKFAYPDRVYGDARPACEALHEQIRLPGAATLRGTRVTEKAIVVKAMVDKKDDLAQTAAMLSLGAYRILNLARRVAAGTAGS
jgi:hypothetical protein